MTYAKWSFSWAAASCTALTNWMVPITQTRREAVCVRVACRVVRVCV